jgi:hypothetical protein
MPKVKGFNVIEHVWFMNTPMGRNTIRKLSKKLTDDIPTLKAKQITNKIRRGIAISRMAKALVPIEYGTKILGHCDTKSYAK